MLTTLLLLACGADPAVDGADAAEPDLPPAPPDVVCPEGTAIQTASSAKGEEKWCDRGGVMHGPYIQYFPDGARAVKGAYADNVPDGDWTQWHPNGQQSSKGKYVRGKQFGSWTWWHDNGNRAEEGDFLAGRKAGQWTAWFPTGLKKEEGIFHNGIKNGTWTYYNDDAENSIQRMERWELGELRDTKVTGPAKAPRR